mgnify:CR=1 FL=1
MALGARLPRTQARDSHNGIAAGRRPQVEKDLAYGEKGIRWGWPWPPRQADNFPSSAREPHAGGPPQVRMGGRAPRRSRV